MFSLFLYYYWTLHLKIMIYVERSPQRKNNNQINEKHKFSENAIQF